jgi:hypothetical protein
MFGHKYVWIFLMFPDMGRPVIEHSLYYHFFLWLQRFNIEKMEEF